MSWLRIRPAAQYAGVKDRTFRAWLKRGLKHVRLPSGLVLCHTDSIDTWLKQFECTKNVVDKIVDSVVRDLVGGK